MNAQSNFLSILVLATFFFACSKERADLRQVDQWIAEGNYQPALTACREALKESYSDTTQFQRIRARIRYIQHGKFFHRLNNLVEKRDWMAAEKQALRLEKALSDSVANKRFYLFELYHLKSVIDSATADSAGYWMAIEKSLAYPTRQRKLKRRYYELAGLHWAHRDSLQQARIYFDRSFRMLPFNALNDLQKVAFLHYMEGRYDSCFVSLKSIPAVFKDSHWQRLEKLVRLLRKQKTDSTRFKLW